MLTLLHLTNEPVLTTYAQTISFPFKKVFLRWIFLGLLPKIPTTVYDWERKYKMRKKGQKRDCSATCAVLHL